MLSHRCLRPDSTQSGPIPFHPLTGCSAESLRPGRRSGEGFVNGTSAPQTDNRSVIVRTSSSPIRYERRLPDGSVEVFSQSEGATSPRKVFLTEWRDAQGNRLSFAYDSAVSQGQDLLRLKQVTDALGQVTTLSYELSQDPFKITKVTDPFGRFATFEYNATGQLIQITDVASLSSEFSYGADAQAGDPTGHFIRSLTTAYGTTTFRTFTPTSPWNLNPWVEATDPLGGVERVEFWLTGAPVPATDLSQTVPAGFSDDNKDLNTHVGIFYDKRTMMLYGANPAKGRQSRFRSSNTYKISGMHLQSEKLPLENRVWYEQQGESVLNGVGPGGRPSKIARVLDDGTSQVFHYGLFSQVSGWFWPFSQLWKQTSEDLQA